MPPPTPRHGRTLAIATLAAAAAALAGAPAALATFPGHNGLIAFHSGTPDGAQIFTVRPDGHDLRQITHVAGDARVADWSPDGRRIAFDVETADSSQVAIMNADGSDLVVLPALGGFEGDPSFTPAGDRVVFERFDGVVDAVWSMRLDGSDRRLVTTAGGVDPNVSPDGRRLSFLGFQDAEPFGHALFASGIDGSDPAPFTPFDIDVGFKHDWAPDGGRVALTHNADLALPGASANVATIRPDGTGLRLVTSYTGGDVNALTGSYSPDGRWIVFRLEDHGRFGLYRIRPDGTHLRPILGLSGFAPRFIDWGPRTDGRGDDD